MRGDTKVKIAVKKDSYALTEGFVAVSDRVTLEDVLLSTNLRSRLPADAGGSSHELANSAKYSSLGLANMARQKINRSRD